MADEGQVISCHTVDQMEKAKISKNLVVVDFTAKQCPPCAGMAPIFAELSTDWTHVVFLKVDVGELQYVAEEWDVIGTPTFLFLKEGSKVDTLVGLIEKDKFKAVITKHATTPTVASASA